MCVGVKECHAGAMEDGENWGVRERKKQTKRERLGDGEVKREVGRRK